MGRNNIVITVKVKGTHKDIFLETLSKGVFTKFHHKFMKNNIIIINNSPVKHILNNLENVLFLVLSLYDGAD